MKNIELRTNIDNSQKDELNVAITTNIKWQMVNDTICFVAQTDIGTFDPEFADDIDLTGTIAHTGQVTPQHETEAYLMSNWFYVDKRNVTFNSANHHNVSLPTMQHFAHAIHDHAQKMYANHSKSLT